MAVNNEISTESKTGPVSSGAAALAAEYLAGQKPSDMSLASRMQVVAGAAVEGTVTHGLDEIVNHPGRAASEVLGAAALGVALRGPIWTRVPALAFAAVGTVSYAQSVAEAGRTTITTVNEMNSRNVAKSSETLKAALGPVLFETALMTAAGAAGAHLATKIPLEAPRVQVASTVALAKDRVQNLLGGDGFPPGMSPALAGATSGHGSLEMGSFKGLFGTKAEPRNTRLEEFLAGSKIPEKIQPMAMTAHGDGGGGGGGGSRVHGDGIAVKASRGVNGENFFVVDNVPPGRTVNVSDAHGAITSVTSDGKVLVGFNTGEGRQLDLSQNISRLVMVEHPTGLKQFQFNNKLVADLEVDPNRHVVRALLGNGDHLHIMDNIKDGFTHFAHRDGLQTWIENSGRVVVQLPNGKLHQVVIPDRIGYIRMVEKADGGKQFRFLNDTGTPIAQKVELPPTPELQAVKAPDELRNWHDLRNYISSRQAAQQNLHTPDLSNSGGGGVYRVEPSAGGVINYHNHGHRGNHQIGQIARIMPDMERTMAHEIAGVPYNIMRGNDLTTVADMGLAMQNHGWLVTNYLDRLDHQDAVFDHHDWY